MQLKKIMSAGTISGLTMGVVLFIGGAIFSRIIYGPQFAPPGKFEPEQLNPFYFIWTKLVIGWLFGLLFAFFYELLPLQTRITGILQSLKYAFALWLLVWLWNISHPVVYGSFDVTNQTFWLFYSLVGFLGYGFSFGIVYKRRFRKSLSTMSESKVQNPG